MIFSVFKKRETKYCLLHVISIICNTYTYLNSYLYLITLNWLHPNSLNIISLDFSSPSIICHTVDIFILDNYKYTGRCIRRNLIEIKIKHYIRQICKRKWFIVKILWSNSTIKNEKRKQSIEEENTFCF